MKFITSIIITISLCLSPMVCSAENLSNAFAGQDNLLDTVAGAQGAGYNTGQTFNNLFGIVIQTILSLLGVFFLTLMVYGGFLWMTDRGNSDQVEKAKKLITAAVIGITIVLASYAISYFVLESISTQVLESSTQATE